MSARLKLLLWRICWKLVC